MYPQGLQFQFDNWNNIDSNKIGNVCQTGAEKTINHDFVDVFL